MTDIDAEAREALSKIVIDVDRDYWNGNVGQYRQYIVDRLMASGLFDDRLAALEADNKALREALAPFAKIKVDIDSGVCPDLAFTDDHIWFQFGAEVLRVGDFRRARAALTSTPQEGGE